MVSKTQVLKSEVVSRGNERYTVVLVPSSTNPDKMYRVDVVGRRCDCPGWKFSKGHQTVCKHLRALGITSPSPMRKSTTPDFTEVL
jgi:hypothetical protein